MFDLSKAQEDAANQIVDWFTKPTKPIFRLFGYAGTGKTTTIRTIINGLELNGAVRFGAYTGKAAMVMRKTGLPAQTIHSLIYKPVHPDTIECNKLAQKIRNEEDTERKKALRKELKEISKVHFVRRDKEDSDLSHIRLLTLDECSMVNDQMYQDLLYFRVPMLVLGDPGQLPPIEGEGALTKEKPDVLLTEIHRQALGNPIIDFATRARHGIFLPKTTMGLSSHVAQNSLTSERVLTFDQILCGKNATRQNLNRRIRTLKGRTGIFPNVGEKLICLKNNAEDGLFNGMICEVVEVGQLYDTSIGLKIKRETDSPEDSPLEVRALRAYFEAYQDKEALENVRWWDKQDTDEFDFGYAITVHKSQGSQWENVLLWDDKMFVGWNKQDRPRWLYTGITRAMETITIAS